MSVLFCGLRHLGRLGAGRTRGTLRALDYRRWLSIRHIIRLYYFVWHHDWVVRWQRHRVVLDNWLCGRRGRRRRWQRYKRQRRNLVILRHQSDLWYAKFMIVVAPLIIMSVHKSDYRFVDFAREYLNITALLKGWLDFLEGDFGHIIELDICLIWFDKHIDTILSILIDLMNNGLFDHAFSCILAADNFRHFIS